MNKKISVANDFSRTPGARYRTDGDFSGQEFYEEILIMDFKLAKESRSKLIIDLDGSVS